MLNEGLVSIPWYDLVDSILPELVLNLGSGALIDLGLSEGRRNALILQIA